MQQGCDRIYPAVIHNTVHGKDVKNAAEMTTTAYMGEVFGPPSQQKLGKMIHATFAHVHMLLIHYWPIPLKLIT